MGQQIQRRGNRPAGRRARAIVGVALATAAVTASAVIPLESGGRGGAGASRHEFDVNAGGCAFTPGRLEVREGDLVKVVLHARDVPHSFAVDSYRIAKRATTDRAVSIEFLADRTGRFPFYCSLTHDEACPDMRGELVVRPR